MSLKIKQAIGTLLQTFHLRAIKNFKFSFDPYGNNTRSVRDMVFHMHSPRILQTNQNCSMKVNVMSDKSEPRIDITFVDGHKVLFKTENLTTLDILQRLKTFNAEKDPKKDENAAEAVAATKKGKIARKK
ncbi:hypothetical protein CHS0354_039320 [Potamilus streckersoni]|uniref:Large ribosomal subunit protein mL53 n=1 Tax=Potamilus streckersoni TaxID=2493646 RepID=A0AAE0TFG9_9BIVA|nr:hypothetical protein CHS0354_039320 [Potamilus streckersoni]